MNYQSILVSIQYAVNQIKWSTPLQNTKALTLCASIFNLYTRYGHNFDEYLSLSSNYFTAILPSKRDYKIKKALIDAAILECNGKYSVIKGIGKGYRFNGCLTQGNISSTATTFTFSSQNSTISHLFPHLEESDITYVLNDDSAPAPLVTTGVTASDALHTQYNFEDYYRGMLKRLTFEKDVDTYIAELSGINKAKLFVDTEIEDEFVDIVFQSKKYRYSRKSALKFADKNGMHLIKYKNKFQFNELDSFIQSKALQFKISYCQSVFNIKNKLFYVGRNDTNNRLDYNLTGLKKELFTKLTFDGEYLAELDIANAQFAIAAYINRDIDGIFKYYAQNGTLYRYVEEQLGLEPEDGKQLMFRVAFDKVKTTTEFDNLRRLFPKFMQWVDAYKQQHGYKMFSNLLQKKEAEIMIDGLLPFLINKGCEVFTVHDALRVKQSQREEISGQIQQYFDSIGFNCLVRCKINS